MIEAPIEQQVVNDQKCSNVAVDAFEHKVLIDSCGDLNRPTAALLHSVSNHLVRVLFVNTSLYKSCLRTILVLLSSFMDEVFIVFINLIAEFKICCCKLWCCDSTETR